MLAEIVIYFRMSFCKHEFKFSENQLNVTDPYSKKILEKRIMISMLCKKCGFHRSVDKLK